MARPREFDRKTVLASATDVFWAQGYAGTSLDDLDRATGLNRGSLYNAFGDKHGLYLECLDLYGGHEIGAAVTLLENTSADRPAIRALFTSAVDAVRLRDDRRGCLLCNAAIELAPHDRDVEQKVVEHLGRLRTAFTTALEHDGSTRSRSDIASLSDHLTASYMGLLVMAKGGFPIAHLKRISDSAAALANTT